MRVDRRALRPLASHLAHTILSGTTHRLLQLFAVDRFRRNAPVLKMLALKSFRTAAITLAGVERAHRIRKGQFSFGPDTPTESLSLSQLMETWIAAAWRCGQFDATTSQCYSTANAPELTRSPPN
jgi:hypothetical protein